MSVSGNYAGGVARPSPVRLTTTSQTDVVTGFDSASVVAAFSLANETASAVTVDCHYFNGTTNFLVFRRSVPAADTVIVSEIPLRLYINDKFKVTAATSNAITVTPILIRSHPNEAAYAPSGAGYSARG